MKEGRKEGTNEGRKIARRKEGRTYSATASSSRPIDCSASARLQCASACSWLCLIDIRYASTASSISPFSSSATPRLLYASAWSGLYLGGGWTGGKGGVAVSFERSLVREGVSCCFNYSPLSLSLSLDERERCEGRAHRGYARHRAATTTTARTRRLGNQISRCHRESAGSNPLHTIQRHHRDTEEEDKATTHLTVLRYSRIASSMRPWFFSAIPRL